MEIHLTDTVTAMNYEVCAHVFQIIFLNNGPEEENIGPRTRLMTKRFDGCPLAITGNHGKKVEAAKPLPAALCWNSCMGLINGKVIQFRQLQELLIDNGWSPTIRTDMHEIAVAFGFGSISTQCWVSDALV